MNSTAFERVAKATVKIVPGEDHGVLVAKGCILTNSESVLYDSFHSPFSDRGFLPEATIANPGGDTFVAISWMLDPVLSLALLEPDPGFQSETAQLIAIDSLSRQTPVPPFVGKIPKGQLPVWIMNRCGEWVRGTVRENGEPLHILMLQTDAEAETLSPGCPVVTEEGELVGIVPHYIEAGSKGSLGFMARPHRALPVWAVERMNHTNNPKRP